MSDGFVALYIFMLAAIAGHVIISRVPVILHTPLMSGSNFIHGIVLIGAMVVLGSRRSCASSRAVSWERFTGNPRTVFATRRARATGGF